MSGLELTGVQVHQTLVASARVEGAPPHSTKAGANMITPKVVEVTYSSGGHVMVEIRGPRVSSPGGPYVTRRIAVAEAPHWARMFAAHHRPLFCQPAALRSPR